jgi:hypothetical protein
MIHLAFDLIDVVPLALMIEQQSSHTLQLSLPCCYLCAQHTASISSVECTQTCVRTDREQHCCRTTYSKTLYRSL